MNLVVAGGGTGGHLFPGVAVAEAFCALGDNNRVLFVGTERGIEARAVPKAGFEVQFITVSGLKRTGWATRLKTLAKLPLSLLQSISILRAAKADVVVGVGGYASGPVLVAARLLGLPTAICEQNSVPGMTNRLLGKIVRRVFATFEPSRSFFPNDKFDLVGNPVRSAFIAAASRPFARPEKNAVFIFGGSQGARPLNVHVPRQLKALVDAGHVHHIRHQTGAADLDAVKARYAELGLKAEVVPFIDDMVAAYRAASVVICRAGATSCAELMALGVPSILVPFPQAADDHQTKNAQSLVDGGAALMCTQEVLVDGGLEGMLERLLGEVGALDEMASASAAMGRIEAASMIAKSLQSGMKGERHA